MPDEEDSKRSRSGPKTQAGKDRSKVNALKHGLCARSTIVAGESIEEYQAVHAALVEQFRPDSPQEEMLVDQLAQCYWQVLRARRKETELLAYQAETPVWEWSEEYFRSVERFNRYRTAIDRSYQRALNTLQKFQKEWRKSHPEIHSREKVTVRHMIFNVGPDNDRFVLRIVSYSDDPKATYTERIPLSEYRGGLYVRETPREEAP